jgi:hypothetical protein
VYINLAIEKVHGQETQLVAQRRFLPQKCAEARLHAFAISKIFPENIDPDPRPLTWGRSGIRREVGNEGGRAVAVLGIFNWVGQP